MYILWQWLLSINVCTVIQKNRYRDTEIKGYVKGVESSSIYTIRAVMLYMSEVSKMHIGLLIQCYVTHVKGVESGSINTIKVIMLLCRRCQKKLKMVLHIFAHNFLNI